MIENVKITHDGEKSGDGQRSLRFSQVCTQVGYRCSAAMAKAMTKVRAKKKKEEKKKKRRRQHKYP